VVPVCNAKPPTSPPAVPAYTVPFTTATPPTTLPFMPRVHCGPPVSASNALRVPVLSPMTSEPELTSGVVGSVPTPALQAMVWLPPPTSRSVRLMAKISPKTSAT
jgi:hypothetical protein